MIEKQMLPALRRLMTLAGLLVLLTGCQLNSATQNMQGVREYKSGRYETAANLFQSVTVENPQNPDGFYNLASTMHQMAYVKAQRARSPEEDEQVRDLQIQAETLYNRCLDLNEDHVECHRGLAVLLVEMGRSEQAFTLLKNWSLKSPDNANAQIELARLYEEHGDTETALLNLHQAMRVGDARSRTHSRAWAAAGMIRERRGELAQAQQNFHQAYTLNRDQPGVGYHLAALNRRMANDSFYSQNSDTRLVRSQGDERDDSFRRRPRY